MHLFVATPFSVSFGGSEVNTYISDNDKLGWSAQSDDHMTSSQDFNKLQQTNVHNYESLLLSDTNSKTPTRRTVSASKSTDLNHMIKHSLNRLGQVGTVYVVSALRLVVCIEAALFISVPTCSYALLCTISLIFI